MSMNSKTCRSRRDFHASILFLVCIVLIFSSPILAPTIRSSAATPSQFASANSAINSAFSALSTAAQSGPSNSPGVSSLASKLNSAIALVQKAEAENATNPSSASSDLQNATQIANQVSSAAPSLGTSLAASRQATMDESIGGLVAIVILGVLAFIYGARVYRIIWLFIYRNHLVRRATGG